MDGVHVISTPHVRTREVSKGRSRKVDIFINVGVFNIFPNIQIHGIRPEIWPGIEGLKPLGSPEDIVPKIFDESVVDEWIYITADEAKHWCNKVAKNGLFVGQSSGSNLAACTKLMEKLDSGKIVTIFNDFGDRYFSAGLWS